MQALRQKRSLAIKVIIAMFAVDAATSIASLARHETFVAVNVIGILCDFIVIAGLGSMQRWAAAFTIVASGKGIGQSLIILQMAFLGGTNGTLQAVFWNWADPLLVIATDIFIITYLFRAIFRGDFSSAGPVTEARAPR